ncbi:MAG: trigger factor [Bifidobacteriaceae bacterium]|nr:trigger factor [Bifidobacteriaceae bacterium]
MKSAVESLEPTKVKLDVEVEPEDLKPALDRAYKEISGQITVPGFRPGKAPRQIIDRRVGRGAVIGQAIEDGLNDWFAEALQETGVKPLLAPKVDMTREPDPADAEPSLAFTATVEIAPPIAVPDLTKVKITVDSTAVSEADIDAGVDALRERFSSLKTVDRPAAPGDYVTLDLTARVGDQEVDSVSGVSHQVGSGDLLKGLDEAVDGLSAGETTTFESALAGGAFAGQTALVEITVGAVKERELPAADDAFAELASSVDTIAELRDEVRDEVRQRKEAEQVGQAQTRLMDHLLETVDFPAPAGVVEQEAQKILGGIEDPDEATREAAEADAVTAVRTQLLLDALAESLGTSVSGQELVEFVLSTAQRYGMDAGTFFTAAQQSGELPHFAAEARRVKAIGEAASRVTVEDTDGNPVDVAAALAPPPPPEGAADADAATAPPQAEDAAPADPAADEADESDAIDEVDEVAIDLDALTP